MKINLHVDKKTITEDGKVAVSFVPVLLDGAENTTLSSGNITLTVPSSQDVFVVGRDYQGEFTEVLPN